MIKTFEDVEKYVKMVGEKRGWKLHPNHDGTLTMLIEGLRDYFNSIGYFNCPCRDTTGERNQDRDILCPCDYAEPDIQEFGHCYCALYFHPKFDMSKPIKMIPERRPLQKDP